MTLKSLVFGKLATSLALASALSMGFSLPAHAENHAKSRVPAQASPEAGKLEKYKDQALQRLKNLKMEGLKIYDKSGNETSLENFIANPPAVTDGMTIGYGEHRFLFRAVPISSGPKGVQIFVTHSVAGSETPISGQVITLSPGMTKQAIQQRFEDAITSLLIFDKSAFVPKTDAKRQTASASSSDIADVMIAGGFILLFLVAAVYGSRGGPGVPAEGGAIIAAVMIIGSLAAILSMGPHK